MSARSGLLIAIILCACTAENDRGVSKTDALVSAPADSMVAPALKAPNPYSRSNQLSSESASSQLIVTIEDDRVIDEMLKIQELANSFEKVTFLRTTRGGELKIYALKLKDRLNPKPYADFLRQFEGVSAVELDGIVGLAGE